MQLRTTLIHASFYDKEQDAWALANLQVLTEAFFSGQRSAVHACSITVHPRIIESLNSRHFACLNWARLSELEPIGAALYKRLFYHLSNLMRPRMDPQLLPPFAKEYQAICEEWLGGLKPEQHKSKIVSNQLGRHLEALKRIRLIRRYEIERMADGDGWKLVFYPGNGFFNDYDEFYVKQWQPQLRPQQNADLRNIQQPLELVAYFHSLLGHEHNRFEKKETEYASKLLTEYLYDEIRDLIQFAVESAKETHFAMQQFGAIKQYLPHWQKERTKRFEASKRLTAIANCTACNALGYLQMEDTRGTLTMLTCPHDPALIDALCKQKGYRRVS